MVAAHRAIGDALGGSDFDDSAPDEATDGARSDSSSPELPFAKGMDGPQPVRVRDDDVEA